MYDVVRISSNNNNNNNNDNDNNNNNNNNNNNRVGCGKYNDGDDDWWFLGFDEKESDVYMKHCTVLIEPIAESMCFYISMQKVRMSRKVWRQITK